MIPFLPRTLPPAAAPLSPADLLRGLATRRSLDRLESDLKTFFGVRHLFLVSSGKAALVVILQALRTLSARREVLIPAYTCFSVPSAIVRAGLQVALCDIDADTLDFDPRQIGSAITEATLCVVPTHLFGRPSDVGSVAALAAARGAFVVEDAAQAMGGQASDGRWLGTQGDVGFFSLGRGKNITCGSGGIILTQSDRIAAAIRSLHARLEPESAWDGLRAWFEALALLLFLHPTVYSIPARLPFLRLGETRFDRDFPIKKMGGAKARLLFHWQARLQQHNEARQRAAMQMTKSLAEASIPSHERQVPFLRLPLLLSDRAAKEALCASPDGMRAGIRSMYPSAIHQVDALADAFRGCDFPVARRVAERLVTLPTHPYVTQNDLQIIADLVHASSVLDPKPERESRRPVGNVR